MDDSRRRSVVRQLLKHSSVYGVGQVVMRLASIVLLPVYTRYLHPEDYGTIAILDLVGTVIGVVLGGGLVAAAGRYHFEAASERARDAVWYTAMTLVLVVTLGTIVPVWLARDLVGRATLGWGVERAGFYFALFLPTVGLSALESGFGSYLNVLKWSRLFVAISLLRLAINVALNVLFLAVFDMGVSALLLGNLITGALGAATLAGIFLRSRGAYAFDRLIAARLWAFGWPLVGSALLATLMHQADRYILRLFVDLRDVGLYSLAYQIGQGINTLVLLPFASIWTVVIFEIGGAPGAVRVYAEVFRYFVYGLSLMLLGASLFARPLLALIAAPEYQEAAAIVPVICFGYLLYSLHEHFKVPALIAKRTTMTLRVMAVATVANIGANLVLVPWLGTLGAAWATVLSFAVFSAGGLIQYRRIAVYPYPFQACAAVVAGMAATFAAFEWTRAVWPSERWLLSAQAVAWAVWAAMLFGGIARLRLSRLLPATAVAASPEV